MHKLISIILFFTILISCKQDLKTPETKEITTINSTNSIAEKIANNNGFKNWKNVSEIHYTFNVLRGRKAISRSWEYHPKTNDVKMVSITDTLHYNRNNIDSLSIKFDKAFINDKFWLLAPFNMLWDSGITFSEEQNVEAPISREILNKLTATYSNEGGYTPGDAYDFYYDKDYVIKEWSFRKGNLKRPSLSTTWEGYKTVNGITFSTIRQDSTKLFKVYFTDISVKN